MGESSALRGISTHMCLTVGVAGFHAVTIILCRSAFNNHASRNDILYEMLCHECNVLLNIAPYQQRRKEIDI